MVRQVVAHGPRVANGPSVTCGRGATRTTAQSPLLVRCAVCAPCRALGLVLGFIVCIVNRRNLRPQQRHNEKGLEAETFAAIGKECCHDT
jgi:hypothetical protein|eukprot:SAG25_NODE_751_length_5572_cov_4.487484_3_plen_90_part_00